MYVLKKICNLHVFFNFVAFISESKLTQEEKAELINAYNAIAVNF